MLSRSAEYAIRALAFLGHLPERPWQLCREIAGELGMPSPFLSKVLQTLTARGILESQRGRGGGFRLARAPGRITLLEVVEPFDHLGDRKLCVLGQKICSDDTPCPLHDTWKATLGRFLDALAETTLADVEPLGRRGYPWNPGVARPRRPARVEARRARPRL